MIQIKREISRTTKEPLNDIFVNCEVYDYGDAESLREVTLPLVKYELLITLNRLQKTAPLYDDTMNLIWDKILDFAQYNHIKGISEGSEMTTKILTNKLRENNGK